MNCKHYYHVVTERPMALNQVIKFNKDHVNGVGHRVNKVLKLNQADQIISADEMDKVILKDFTKWTQIANREIVLEEIRLKDFPQYPSRMASLYVSTSYEDALEWAKYFISLGRKTFQIVKLKCKGNSFTADARNCWYESPSKEDSINKANNYWHNACNVNNETPILETIIDGEITVVEILKTYDVK